MGHMRPRKPKREAVHSWLWNVSAVYTIATVFFAISIAAGITIIFGMTTLVVLFLDDDLV